jgi:hypothetical protein
VIVSLFATGFLIFTFSMWRVQFLFTQLSRYWVGTVGLAGSALYGLLFSALSVESRGD